MESVGLSILMTVIAIIFGLKWVLKKVNCWIYETPLGEMKYSLPPGDLGWPLIGNMWSFLTAFKTTTPDSFMDKMITRYGNTGIYKVFMFGKPSVIVTMPEFCKKVLTDDDLFQPGWPKATLELIGRKSFVDIPFEEHKRLRRLTAAPVNGPEALSMYLAYIEKIVVSELENWSKMGQIEFLTELRSLTFKIIVHIFLGSASDQVREALEKEYTALNYGVRAMAINVPGFAYYKALKFLTELGSPTFKIIVHIFLGSASDQVKEAIEKEYTALNYGFRAMAINVPGFVYYKALKARKRLVAIFQSIVDERRKATYSPKERTDMMDNLLAVEDENGIKLDDETIIDVLVMYLNAGHESSGHITMWATILLQEHPHFFQIAKAEQEEIVKNRPSTRKGLILKEVRQMEYLSKVIDETLRLITFSLMVFREAKTDVTISGYTIPKGWKVMTWFRSVHLDPEIYPNPTEFNPSRWENLTPKVGTFLPFGAGSRLCPGNDLAKMEISIFLHYFLLGYKVERLNPECPTMYLPHTRPKDNCLATIRKL